MKRHEPDENLEYQKYGSMRSQNENSREYFAVLCSVFGQKRGGLLVISRRNNRRTHALCENEVRATRLKSRGCGQVTDQRSLSGDLTNNATLATQREIPPTISLKHRIDVLRDSTAFEEHHPQ